MSPCCIIEANLAAIQLFFALPSQHPVLQQCEVFGVGLTFRNCFAHHRQVLFLVFLIQMLDHKEQGRIAVRPHNIVADQRFLSGSFVTRIKLTKSVSHTFSHKALKSSCD